MDWDNLRVFLELARSKRLMEAATRIGIDGSTVSRRIRHLEADLGTHLFDRGNHGFALTSHGERLLRFAEQIESTLEAASEEIGGDDQVLSGHVRIGATEGFGSFVLAPHLVDFCARHPSIVIDLLPMPRFVDLYKREADFAVSIERPIRGDYVVSKLTDYTLKLYGTAEYLRSRPPIRDTSDFKRHMFVSYVDDLIFSAELEYLKPLVPASQVAFRSTSVVAQYMAACRGIGLAILPCFLAHQREDLIPVLDNEITVTRTFWLVIPTDRRHVTRIRTLTAWLRDTLYRNRAFLMGDERTMTYL